jgi:hypothetical protein
METISFLDPFQGIATLVASEPKIMIGCLFLMLLGFLLIYLGSKNVREPLLMIPLGLGMSSINAAGMFREGGKTGALFVDPLMSDPVGLVNHWRDFPLWLSVLSRPDAGRIVRSQPPA